MGQGEVGGSVLAVRVGQGEVGGSVPAEGGTGGGGMLCASREGRTGGGGRLCAGREGGTRPNVIPFSNIVTLQATMISIICSTSAAALLHKHDHHLVVFQTLLYKSV